MWQTQIIEKLHISGGLIPPISGDIRDGSGLVYHMNHGELRGRKPSKCYFNCYGYHLAI